MSHFNSRHILAHWLSNLEGSVVSEVIGGRSTGSILSISLLKDEVETTATHLRTSLFIQNAAWRFSKDSVCFVNSNCLLDMDSVAKVSLNRLLTHTILSATMLESPSPGDLSVRFTGNMQLDVFCQAADDWSLIRYQQDAASLYTQAVGVGKGNHDSFIFED